MSNTISSEEYRKMMGKKEPAKQIIETASACAKVAKNAKALAEKLKPEPSGKTGKLTVEEAVRQVVLMLDLDEPQIKKAEYVINQLRINGKL